MTILHVSRTFPVTTENDPAAAKAVAKIVCAVYTLETVIVAREYTANQPRQHQYELVDVP